MKTLLQRMTNKEKFDEYQTLVEQYTEHGLIHSKPSVYEMEKLKYSDDPLIRRVCAFIESADKLYMELYMKSIDTLIDKSCPVYVDYRESCQALKDHEAEIGRKD